MKNDFKAVYDLLHRIYLKHLRKYSGNSNSKQMCCMWSTKNPPDTIEGTPPLEDIENAFNIIIDDEAAMELYDMYLDEAARKIMCLISEQCG